MKMNNKLINSALVIGLLTFGACKDYLENEPQGALSTENVTTAANAEALVTAAYAGIGNDEMIVTVLNILGLEEEKRFYVYPVPANNTLFVEAPGRIDVSLITMTGTVLTSQTMATGNGSIDLSDYPNGLYILQVKSELRTIRQVVAKN